MREREIMRMIISPAKKMRVDTDSLPVQALPDFLLETERLLAALRAAGESYIVRGNNDKDWAADLPHSLTFTVEGIRFFWSITKKMRQRTCRTWMWWCSVIPTNTRNGRRTACCG